MRHRQAERTAVQLAAQEHRTPVPDLGEARN